MDTLLRHVIQNIINQLKILYHSIDYKRCILGYKICKLEHASISSMNLNTNSQSIEW